jgi:hypothetical protein
MQGWVEDRRYVESVQGLSEVSDKIQEDREEECLARRFLSGLFSMLAMGELICLDADGRVPPNHQTKLGWKISGDAFAPIGKNPKQGVIWYCSSSEGWSLILNLKACIVELNRWLNRQAMPESSRAIATSLKNAGLVELIGGRITGRHSSLSDPIYGTKLNGKALSNYLGWWGESETPQNTTF